MDSLDFLTTAQIASVVHGSQKALQNKIEADPANPARAVIRFPYADLPLVRLGRTWLARRRDVEALLDVGPAAAPATAPVITPIAPSRRLGRPRNSAARALVGSAE
jgi:hypothetical protein